MNFVLHALFSNDQKLNTGQQYKREYCVNIKYNIQPILPKLTVYNLERSNILIELLYKNLYSTWAFWLTELSLTSQQFQRKIMWFCVILIHAVLKSKLKEKKLHNQTQVSKVQTQKIIDWSNKGPKAIS